MGLDYRIDRWRLAPVIDRRNEDGPNVFFVSPEKVVLGSSIVSNTEELLSMDRQEKKGRSVSIYEQEQNLIDYSNLHNPIILLDMADGSCRAFSGNSSQLDVGREKVKSVRMVSFGEGMAPEDVVIFSHGGGQGTLGINGRGGSVAFAYFVENGMTVQIASNRGGSAFIGEVKMVDIPSKEGVRRMEFQYEDAARIWRDDERLTEITIGQPTDQFLRSLYKSPEIFLHANPNYGPARLVTPNIDAVYPERIEAWRGEEGVVEVECLLGIPEKTNRQERPNNSLMIGGLLVESGWSETFVLPWAVWGGEHFTRYGEQVTRSKDSLRAEGQYVKAITTYLSKTTSTDILGKLLDVNDDMALKSGYNSRYSSDLPKELTMDYDKKDISKETATKLAELLRQRHDGELPILVGNKFEYDSLKRKFGDSRKLLMVAGVGLETLLEVSGCESGRTILHQEEKETLGTLDLRLINEIKAASYVASLIGSRDLKLSRREGALMMVLENPDFIRQLNIESFSSLPEGDSEIYKALAAVGFLINGDCGVKIRQVKDGRVATFSFEKDRGYHERINGNSGEIRLKVKVLAVTDLTGDIPEGTILELDYGDDDLRSRLEKGFIRTLKEVVKRGGLEKDIESMTPEELRAELLRREKEKVAKENQKKEVKLAIQQFKGLLAGKLTLNQWLTGDLEPRVRGSSEISESTTSLGVSRLSEREDYSLGRIETNGMGIMVADYYRSEVADDYEIKDGSITNVSNGEWQGLVGVTRIPNEWQISVTVNVGENWTDIYIKRDMTDITYLEQEGLEVVVDRENKTVKARRMDADSPSEVKFYQRKCKNGIFRDSEPKDINYRIGTTSEDINESLSVRLRKIRDDKKMSLRDKNAMVTLLHQETFKYDDDPEIETRVMDGVESMARFESNLVNIGRGICNYSAARLSIMKRLCGLPTKVESGVVTSNKSLTSGSTHAWLKSWDGKQWYNEESAMGVVPESITGNITGMAMDSFGVSFANIGRDIREFIQAGYSPQVVAHMIYGEVRGEFGQAIWLFRNFPEAAKSMVAQIKDPQIRQSIDRLVSAAIVVSAESVSEAALKVSEYQKSKLSK